MDSYKKDGATVRSASGAFERLLTRAGKVAFMKLSTDSSSNEYHRMQYFTSMSKSMNAQEYSRNYVDVPSEVTDVTGYSPAIEFAFDRYDGNEVQADIIKVFDDELIGTDAVREIIIVDMTSGDTSGKYKALKRKYSIMPDAEGDGTDAYTYSGSFTSNGEQTEILVSVSADGLIATESGVSAREAGANAFGR